MFYTALKLFDGAHPVVREELVDDFPHGSRLVAKDLRLEIEDDVQHGGLHPRVKRCHLVEGRGFEPPHSQIRLIDFSFGPKSAVKTS